MEKYIISVLLIALLAAFLLILANKWGVIEKVQVRGNDFFSEMFSCGFCLSWWTCVLLSILFALIQWDGSLLFAALFATPITRRLI